MSKACEAPQGPNAADPPNHRPRTDAKPTDITTWDKEPQRRRSHKARTTRHVRRQASHLTTVASQPPNQTDGFQAGYKSDTTTATDAQRAPRGKDLPNRYDTL